MKKFILVLSLLTFIYSLTACSTTYRTSRNTSSSRAPGQVKKAYGSKSDKAFAPGQQKKNKKYKRKN
ncbi:hypothetical protein [Leeuwenhoekiella sp. W20_SRS_FM14]|uniref:hypothetical protein n=1 Tax=Leeuwenhoekiella sp. W20_SRS_FM14 TaxID=3240270 RepID=UPI003F9BD84E